MWRSSNMPLSTDSEAPLVPALFPDRASAEAAVNALRQSGVDMADIGVAVPVPERTRISDESGKEALEGAVAGAAIGGRLGILGGIGLAVAALGPIGVGGLFLAGASGLVWGGAVGGLLGVITRVRRRPDVDAWSELALEDQSVLVAVRVRDWSHETEMAALLTRSGAVTVLDHLELDHTWQELEVEHRSGQPAPAAG
jgi:hypothetical protein